MGKIILYIILLLVVALNAKAQFPSYATRYSLGIIPSDKEVSFAYPGKISSSSSTTIIKYTFTLNKKTTINIVAEGLSATKPTFGVTVYKGTTSVASMGLLTFVSLQAELEAGQYTVEEHIVKGYNLLASITFSFNPDITISGFTDVTSSAQNYIYSRTMANTSATEYIDNIQYFDGLGRPTETVQKGITPSKADLVTYQEYDSFGRESNSWLPSVVLGNNGAFLPFTSFRTKAMATYSNDSAYSRPVYESSPQNYIVEQYGAGKEWYANKKAVRTEYLTNQGTSGVLACIKYIVGGSYTSIELIKGQYYTDNQLYATKHADEDGNLTYEFKNKQGQVVLIRQMEGTTPHDTYYVYDDFDNQCFVLPPRIQDEGITQTKLNELAYQYKYDDHNRCIAKKIPGCDWIYYVYDKADRLIFTQDGEQRAKSEWTFSIPDALGRVVLSGTCKNSLNYAANPLDISVVKAERSNATNTYKGYATLTGVTLTTPTILSVNYYDDYAFIGYNGIPNDGNTQYVAETGYGICYGDHQTTNKHKNKGLLTGSMTAQMNPDGTAGTTYLYSVMYYDNRGRLIQTKGNNQLAGGIEKEYIAYNFTGQPTQRKHVHQVTGKNTQTEVYAYTYDHAGRLLTTTHQLTDGTTVKPQVILAENSYDDLGRLKTNKKGGVAGTLATYTYNVRSWTKSIAGSLFTENLYYNESYGGNVPRFNGNITAMNWTIQGETVPRGYAFAYDNLSRLTGANYLLNGSASATNDYKVENIIYDKHGNIKNLRRYGKTSSGATYALVDNLTMTYSGNQLIHAADAITNPAYSESADFKDKVSTTGTIEYTYTANGAMNKNLNKGISEIQYNSLNLPQVMIINSPTAKAKNYYTYSASGVKLRTEQRYDPNLNVSPVNTTNPANDGLADYMNRDYAGNIIYETAKNGSAITNRTRILVDGGYWENNVYYFYVTDHLGNNRVVVNQSGTVTQKNHYYPFGTAFADKYDNGTNQPYKYNGKELDGMHQLNLYDYSARYYESAIGRFISVDPHAEGYYSWSPYAYVGNNPLKYIDPTGMDWYIFNLDNGGNYSQKIEQGGTHRMAVMSYEMTKDGHEYTKITFVDFNDPDVDAKSIDNGEITRFEMLSDATVDRIMNASGVRSDAARNSPWSYAKNEAGGKMDYGHYRSLSKNTFYVRDNTAYNVGDIGNYLWGMGMAELGFNLGTAKMGAHINNALWGKSQWADKYNFGTGTYSTTNSFWDSPGDQRAITKGYSNSPLGRSRLEYQRQYNEKVRAKWNKTFKTSFSIY